MIYEALSHEDRISALTQICSLIEVLAVDSVIVQNALNSGWKDFEDSIQYHSAKSDQRISGIITRNTKDFSKSELDIYDSLSFCK